MQDISHVCLAHNQAYFVDKQYRRALAVLRRYSLLQPESLLKHRYLGALCLAECKEWEEVLDLLGQETPNDNARQRRVSLSAQQRLTSVSDICIKTSVSDSDGCAWFSLAVKLANLAI